MHGIQKERYQQKSFKFPSIPIILTDTINNSLNGFQLNFAVSSMPTSVRYLSSLISQRLICISLIEKCSNSCNTALPTKMTQINCEISSSIHLYFLWLQIFNKFHSQLPNQSKGKQRRIAISRTQYSLDTNPKTTKDQLDILSEIYFSNFRSC